MTKLGKLTLLACAAASCVAASQASAQVLTYTSFQGRSGHSYYGPESVGTGGDHLGYLPAGYIALAASFTTGISGTLDHFDLALGAAAGFPGATITLVNDNGSGAPSLTAPVLETIIAQKLPGDSAQKTKSTLVRSVAKPSIVAGQTYWIILTTAAYDGNLLWYQSNKVDQSVKFTANGGQTFGGYTSHQAAFDVYVMP